MSCQQRAITIWCFIQPRYFAYLFNHQINRHYRGSLWGPAARNDQFCTFSWATPCSIQLVFSKIDPIAAWVIQTLLSRCLCRAVGSLDPWLPGSSSVRWRPCKWNLGILRTQVNGRTAVLACLLDSSSCWKWTFFTCGERNARRLWVQFPGCLANWLQTGTWNLYVCRNGPQISSSNPIYCRRAAGWATLTLEGAFWSGQYWKHHTEVLCKDQWIVIICLKWNLWETFAERDAWLSRYIGLCWATHWVPWHYQAASLPWKPTQSTTSVAISFLHQSSTRREYSAKTLRMVSSGTSYF